MNTPSQRTAVGASIPTQDDVQSLPPILVIEDDPEIAETISAELATNGYRVDLRDTYQAGLESARSSRYAVILVDRGLQGKDGVEIIELLRGEGDRTPAIVISAMASVDDRIVGLQAGGDDYLVKPFDVRELIARIQALVRRRVDDSVTRLRCGDLEMNLIERTATLAGRSFALLPREFRLLEYFMRRPGQVVTRSMLLKDVWNFNFMAQTNAVDVQIGYLRRKLDPTGARQFIVNVRGVGFRLNAQD
jgi:two-component system OmpR family response regulator